MAKTRKNSGRKRMSRSRRGRRVFRGGEGPWWEHYNPNGSSVRTTYPTTPQVPFKSNMLPTPNFNNETPNNNGKKPRTFVPPYRPALTTPSKANFSMSNPMKSRSSSVNTVNTTASDPRTNLALRPTSNTNGLGFLRRNEERRRLQQAQQLMPSAPSRTFSNKARNAFTPGRKVQMAQNFTRKTGQKLKNLGSRVAFAVTPGPRAAAAIKAATPGRGFRQSLGVASNAAAYGLKSAVEGAASGLGGLASGIGSAVKSGF